MIKQNKSISLRLQGTMADEIRRFAELYSVSCAYVYRSAIRDFINSKIYKKH